MRHSNALVVSVIPMVVKGMMEFVVSIEQECQRCLYLTEQGRAAVAQLEDIAVTVGKTIQVS